MIMEYEILPIDIDMKMRLNEIWIFFTLKLPISQQS